MNLLCKLIKKREKLYNYDILQHLSKVVQQFYIMARQEFISANILDRNAEISCDILFEEIFGN